jgi:hypothetical protein
MAENDRPSAPQHYLLFVSRPTGYELAEREGELPAPGTEIEDGDTRFEVAKIGPSPLPGDTRACAYLQPA